MKNSKNELKIKNSKGITLIALVITIIVLIILAGVSINLVIGDNGIITKAKEAKTETEQAKLNEEVALNEIVEYMENNGATTSGGSTLKKDINGVEEGQSGYLGSGYDDPYIPVGFTHIGTANWNSGYQIQETSTGNVFVWVPCVLDQVKVKYGDNVQTFKKTLPSTTDTTDPYYMYNKNNYTITEDVTPADAIKTSVGTYGGFYIAAYEAGVPLDNDGNEISPTSATTSQKARSVKDAKAWTDITRTNAITAAANMIDETSGVKSGLISGECWDTTLQWMAHSSTNAANEPNLGYDTDSTGNGWYEKDAKTTTGKSPINNIYDMAGNVWEWTTENCTFDGHSYLVIRGGIYFYSGSVYPAASRYNFRDRANVDVAFRVVLYK